jgi:hypothetical protein
MSLTSHLDNPSQSPIGRFFQEHFAFTVRLTKDANRQLREASLVVPVEHPWPYSQIGMALDYRIRYSFAITPHRELVAWQGARFLLHAATPGEPSYSLAVIEAFFEGLQAALEQIQPVGRLLDKEAEQLLARYCFLLGLLEEPFRSGRYHESLLMVPAPRQRLEDLLAIPQQIWIDDLCNLSRLFYNTQAHLLSRPHLLNPTFAGSIDVGGADADIIVDGCLIDIKTTKQSKADAAWIRQLAGYLLLDYHDTYRLNAVGLYFARHGILLSWPAEHFIQMLTGESGVSVATLRQEFQDLIGNRLPRK